MSDASGPHEAAPDLEEAARLIARGSFQEAHAHCLEALRLDGQNAEAYFLLAMIAAEHQNYVRAAQLLDQAITRDGSQARYHAQRARCLAQIRRTEDARIAAERAAALHPEDALTLDTIGVVLSQAGAHEEAIQYFERASALDPQNANILHNLGVSRQFSGDFSGAEEAFRGELALQPAARRPYSALAHLSKQTPSQNFIVELETQFGEAREPNAQLQIGHALAKTFEDLGDYAQAFAWLQRAKAAKRVSVATRMPDYARIFVAAEAPAHAPAAREGFSSDAPIFIVGMPRTGTTLVDRILSSHPAVRSAGELGHFGALAHQLTETREGEEEAMYARAAKLHFAVLGRAYIEATRARAGGAAHFIDKMPVNFLNAALIQRALPNARIICLRRHPMDACLSNYRQIFGPEVSAYFYTLSLEDTARYYKLFDDLAARWRALLPAERYTEISYEGLVENFESEARRLVAFCGLDWDARCLSFHENAAPVATASSVQVRSPIYSSSIGRWKRYGAALAPLRAALEQAGVIVT